MKSLFILALSIVLASAAKKQFIITTAGPSTPSDIFNITGRSDYAKATLTDNGARQMYMIGAELRRRSPDLIPAEYNLTNFKLITQNSPKAISSA